jgi:[acyl-carrier-protein] S-malonyltransferase
MDGMTKALETVKFRNPTRPVIANCTGKPLTASWELKEELIQQLCGCVRWQNSVDYMVNAGVTNFIEFGPGRALSGMVKRISDCVEVTSVNNVESTESLVNGHSSPA